MLASSSQLLEFGGKGAKGRVFALKQVFDPSALVFLLLQNWLEQMGT